MSNHVDTPDWSTIPEPKDDGAARHLAGSKVPPASLPATDGTTIDLSTLPGRVVVFAYPRTGRPGVENPEGWDQVPGARGCTPQTCAFRDRFEELKALGVARLFGLSTQPTAYQREVADRLHLPFPLLSDEGLTLAGPLRLPTFEVQGMTLLRRLTLVIDDGTITHAFYPVFPPDRNAGDVLAWLRGQSKAPTRTAVLLIAHGSRHAPANEDLLQMAARIAGAGGYPIVEPAFLELAGPDIAEGGKRCVEAGAGLVLMVPYFLSSGVHLIRDLTAARDELVKQHPGVEFRLGPPLGPDPLLETLVARRARQLESGERAPRFAPSGEMLGRYEPMGDH